MEDEVGGWGDGERGKKLRQVGKVR